MANTRLNSGNLPELSLMAGTRSMIGGGLALLLSDRSTPEQRRAVGWTLFLAGALMSIPIMFGIFTERGVRNELEPPIQKVA